MSTQTQIKPPGNKSSSTQSNPFARALAESEKASYSNGSDNPFETPNFLADSMAKTGGNFPDLDSFHNKGDDQKNNFDPAWIEQQRLQLEKQQKRDALRRKLHDQINPIDQTDIFSAREEEVKKEIDKLRDELRLLSLEVNKFHKEIEVSLMAEVPNPGQDGKYYISFFQQLRAFIMLLRQKIKSARTWATQMHSKKSKRKKRGGALIFEGKAGHEKTKTIFDMMADEVATARSGG